MPRLTALVLGALLALAAVPRPTAAQYTIESRSGLALRFDREALLAMHDTTRALEENLETDPRVLYYTGYGPEARQDSAGEALPWNAIEVITDSTVALTFPSNLREADRAYSNYAVLRMQAVRSDPDVPCDSVFARERRAVELFVDGWIVARTLFGGPPYAPLDELAFARAAGQLPGYILAHEDRQLGGCLRVIRRQREEAVAEYRRWRRSEYLGEDAGP